MKRSDIETLKSCRLFHEVNDAQLKIIADNYGEIQSSEKGEVIFSENKYSRSLVVILKGRASVTKSGGSGKILMSILTKGDIFGMAALFYEEDSFMSDITALEKVVMLKISKENLREIFSKHPVVSENYITILSERIHFLSKKISTYTKPETIQKVSSFLIQYSDEEKSVSVLPFSITNVAEAINAGRASVYRAFDVLESNGIIKRNGREISILDYERLKNQ